MGHNRESVELPSIWQRNKNKLGQGRKIYAAADLYLLKHILHDWSDEEAVRILRGAGSNPARTLNLVKLSWR
jgi:O-methyltransferase domain